MNGYQREKIWDPVTRLWHWALVIVVTLGWCLGEFMSFSTIQWHFYCGYTVLGLMAFRLLWGFIGPTPVQHRTLLTQPRYLWGYARGALSRSRSGTSGHNPIGSLSVIAMILLLSAQATSGLFIGSDSFFEYGPLNHLLPEDITLELAFVHYILSRVILAVVLLHVAAIFFYLIWKRENLIYPMINGWKWVKSNTDSPQPPDTE